MPRQVFTAGEILTAANMNDLSDSTVMVFDDSAARGSAIPTPAEGMVTYLKDTNLVEAYTGAAFEPVSQPGILQVLSTTVTTQFTTGGTFADVTGFAVTITPTSATSKVLVFASYNVGNTTSGGDTLGRLMRDAVVIGEGSGGGHYTASLSSNNQMYNAVALFLDSPATTSATTYKIQIRSSGGTATFNRNGVSTASFNTASTITVMEVAV